MVRILFIVLLAVSAFLPPAAALFTGIFVALVFKNPYPKQSKTVSKYLLQAAVVGLGFGMNIHKALETGLQGLTFTIVSVAGVMIVGYLLGRCFGIRMRLSYLISSGTAICGGSAIAAISPVIDANNDEVSMSMAVIFTLNAVALFVFPPVGRMLGLDEYQFGLWAAIAIHDTSSVVGAGATYGSEALVVATTVKLTRALWIIPLSVVSLVIFRNKDNKRFYFPWFILMFVATMALNTYVLIPANVLSLISLLSRKSLSVTLFLIGSTLTIGAVRNVGGKPVLMGVALWIIISVISLLVII